MSGLSEENYSGDGSSELILEERVWFIFAVAIGSVLLAFTVCLVIVLVARCCRIRKAKLRLKDDCDYNDIVDRTIVELFEVLDKRSTAPSRNPSTSTAAETSLKMVSQPQNNKDTGNFVDSVIINSQPEESLEPTTVQPSLPKSDPKSSNTQFLKPLAAKVSMFASNESVYDNLEDDSHTSTAQETSKGKGQTMSSSAYDDTVIVTKSPPKSPSSPSYLTTPTTGSGSATGGNAVVYDDTVPKSPISEADYAVPHDGNTRSRTTSPNTDEAGYYVLPDNFPPHNTTSTASQPLPLNYSYPGTHNLTLPSNSQGLGEVRSTQMDEPSPSKRCSSIYTNIDDISPSRGGESHYQNIDDVTYSNIDEAEENYLYAREHMLVSPTRLNAVGQGKVVTKPKGHHQYDPIQTKSKSLPGHTHPSSTHTYANLKQTRSVKARPEGSSKSKVKRLPLEEETVNPLYSSSDDILGSLQIETTNPLYDSSANAQPKHQKQARKSSLNKARSSSSTRSADVQDKDYLASTDAWLEHLRVQSSQPDEDNEDVDHTYMGILVRERVDHDYTVPKQRMVSFSSDSGVRNSKLGQRTYSLGNNTNHGYENQAMWLANESSQTTSSSSMSQTDHSQGDRKTSTGYMGLFSGSYETHYTLPNAVLNNGKSSESRI